MNNKSSAGNQSAFVDDRRGEDRGDDGDRRGKAGRMMILEETIEGQGQIGLGPVGLNPAGKWVQLHFFS